MIKVGDGVKVVKRTAAPINWIPEMEDMIGVEGEVVEKFPNRTFIVEFSEFGKCYLYNEEALELVIEKHKLLETDLKEIGESNEGFTNQQEDVKK